MLCYSKYVENVSWEGQLVLKTREREEFGLS